MVRRAGILLVIAALAAACSTSTGGSSPTTVDQTVAAEASDAPDADIQEALLTLDDMPPGWSITTELNSDEGEEGLDSDSAFCPGSEAAGERIQSAGAEIAFSQGDLGPFVFEAVAESQDGMYEQIVEALDMCIGQNWSDTDDGGTVTEWTMSQLSAADFGDQSKGYRLSGKFNAGLGTIDLIVGEASGLVGIIMAVSITSIFGGGDFSAADFTKIVETASGKLG